MILVLLFVVAPLVELYVIVRTGEAIGFLNTVGLMLAIAVVGSWLLRREGVRVWNRFASQVQSGQVPSKEIADGVCLFLAGALMIAPGFVSDAAALLLLFPPTRALARGWLMRRRALRNLGGFAARRSHVGSSRPIVIDAVYDARATEVDPRRSSGAPDATGRETPRELDG